MKKFLVAISLFSMAVAYWLSRGAKPLSSDTATDQPTSIFQPPSRQEIAEANEAASKKKPSMKADSTTPEEPIVDPKIEEYPSLSEVRDEVSEDPDSTPPSVLKFAAYLAPKLDRAFQNEKFAGEFIRELVHCADDRSDEAVASAQAVCLSAAERLTEKYPRLQEDVNSWLSSMPREVIRLARLITPSLEAKTPAE